jgi:predicted RNA-binding protein YlqC (UPF0109 family)
MNKLSNLRLPNFSASMHQINQIAQTLNDITRLMVDRPEDVLVRIQGTEPNSVLKLAVHPTDVGKVIGKEGRTARALRTIIQATASTAK